MKENQQIPYDVEQEQDCFFLIYSVADDHEEKKYIITDLVFYLTFLWNMAMVSGMLALFFNGYVCWSFLPFFSFQKEQSWKKDGRYYCEQCYWWMKFKYKL